MKMWYNCCGLRTSSVSEDTPPPQMQQQIQMPYPQRYSDSPRIEGRQDGIGEGSLEPTRRSYLGGVLFMQQQQLLDWRRGPVIGEGGFSRVYKAWSETHRRYIAVKEIFVPHRGRQYSENLKMFENEVSNLAKMKHPHIVEYLGCERDEENQQVRVFMEYVGSTSVNNHIQQFGEFTEEQGRRICYQVLQGLHYLHDQNIIHRDIKGSNILISDHDGNAKLVDFGVSKQIKEVMQHGDEGDGATSITPIGTPLWWAPEVWKGGAHSKASDVWSLGATMIEMLVADNPWQMHNSNLLSVLNSLSSKQNGPTIPENISNEAKKFLISCLDWKPSRRLSTGQLLRHDFFQPEVALSIRKEIPGSSCSGMEANRKQIQQQKNLPVLVNSNQTK
eukprot:TRINITY_DN14235_c0_g1_i4.p2 TRINITY_DN14235_c0_g1~~TRINITY_DN14235_c0_g1_i4.p2  ORF type:complete len:389 (-),score=45.35 TRINITY_DN14235_c0_g1_i4:1420-2586(-)